jgi:cytochrome bd ubiquinol oxidase subunit II
MGESPLLVEGLLVVMVVAAAAYITFGGADFGAGMVEAVLARSGRGERVEAAIAPVWEANHVWLVLIAVLAFVGFPRWYVELTTYLHVPLLLVLLGIVARGSAFTFRHYDPEGDRRQTAYSLVFRISSVMTPLFLGVVVAASVDGRIGACEGVDFVGCYLAPWNTLFAWSVGLFLCCLFAFEGTALLAAEHAGERRSLPHLRLARALHVSTVVSGAAVFAAAWASDSPWFAAFVGSPLGIGAMAVATLLVPVIALSFSRANSLLLRLAMGAQSIAILIGFFAPSYPILLRLRDGDHVRLPEAAAPHAVLNQLALAVAVGLSLILPALIYLIRVYKAETPR